MGKMRAKQKILTMQSQMIIWSIPFISFFMMTATAQVLKETVRRKMGRATQRRRLSGTLGKTQLTQNHFSPFLSFFSPLLSFPLFFSLILSYSLSFSLFLSSSLFFYLLLSSSLFSLSFSLFFSLYFSLSPLSSLCFLLSERTSGVSPVIFYLIIALVCLFDITKGWLSVVHHNYKSYCWSFTKAINPSFIV